MNLTDLPVEIVWQMFLDRDVSDIIAVCKVNKALNQVLCKSSEFLTEKYNHDFPGYIKIKVRNMKEFRELYKAELSSEDNEKWDHGAFPDWNDREVKNIHEELADAAGDGDLKKVINLLKHGADPSYKGSQNTIFMAVINGHANVVRRLLKDKRVDPSVDDNQALRWAAKDGYLEMVELLLQHPKVDPSANNNYALKMAAEAGHFDVVDRLMQDKRVDPSADNNDAVRLADEEFNFDIVERLLQDKRVDPSVAYNYGLKIAELSNI